MSKPNYSSGYSNGSGSTSGYGNSNGYPSSNGHSNGYSSNGYSKERTGGGGGWKGGNKSYGQKSYGSQQGGYSSGGQRGGYKSSNGFSGDDKFLERKNNKPYEMSSDQTEFLNLDKVPDVDRSVEISVAKNFYNDLVVDKKKSLREIRQFLDDKCITLKGDVQVPPFFEFSDCKWPERISGMLKKLGYATPTPIQAVTLPLALAGRDVIGIAQTGSGKTLAFTLPAFIHMAGQPTTRHHKGPMALVLSPTRELAMQTMKVVDEFRSVRSVCVYGGSSKGYQLNQIRNINPQIIVATPGRLIDFICDMSIRLDNVTYLVLDEADRMLDMGFEPQIRMIMKQIPANRQTLMYSATWPKEVRQLAADFFNDPVQVNIGSLELAANHNIKQIIQIMAENDKCFHLMKLLNEISVEPDYKVIIFAETKKKTDILTRRLRADGIPAMCIHGGKTQKEREWVLSEFRNDNIKILVATDVAARGLGKN